MRESRFGRAALGAALAVVIGSGSGVARADEAEEAGAALLAGLSPEGEERLLGTTTFGVYVETKSFGTVRVEVERAAPETGAVYRQRALLALAFGPKRLEEEEVVLLDARLGLVRHESRKRETEGEQVAETVRVQRRDGDGWVMETTRDGATTTARATGGADHDDAWFLLARAFGDRPGTYAFPRVAWPKGEGEPRWERITFEVGAAAAAQHRGAPAQAHAIKITKGQGVEHMLVSTERAVLSLKQAGAPFVMLAGTDEEAGRDLPPAAGAKVQGVGEVREAVEVYFRALAGQVSLDELDRVLDWAAVLALSAGGNPQLETLTPAQFGALLKAELKKKGPALAPEQVDAILPLLVVEVTEDRAIVRVPGGDAGAGKAFRLERREAGWLIVDFPR